MAAPLGRTRPRGDDGQAVGALILLVAFLLLALVTYVVFPLGAASNDRARARTAADAAALAGAEEIRTTWLNTSVLPGLLQFPLEPLPPVTPASGMASAQGYAAKNGSSIRRYNVNPSAGQVEVEVEANQTTNENTTERATSEATAEMDIDFDGCDWDDKTLPVPVPQGGPPFITRTLTCGSWSATYNIANLTASFPTVNWIGKQMPQLYADLEPRLVT